MAIDPLDVDAGAPPSGTGCQECVTQGGWWVHLRRCALCGHIGCCDSSPSQHATAHFAATGHPLMRSFEPGETWWWDYRTRELIESGPELAPPESRPASQAAPGPAERLPQNWRELIHR
ncbi:MAG: UBP-type zinc finger domain-containing protein [Arthrobacter sp.]|jgi:hypothetical protein|nr:UBP-type zinc finger domain-containing protein [Arthrobacter sp.]